MSGLINARECLRQGLKVQVFEKKKEIGGLWVFQPISEEHQLLDGRIVSICWFNVASVMHPDYAERSIAVQSSVYDEMRANLPRELMGFTEYPFDNTFPGSFDSQMYPSHLEVRSK